MGTILDELSPGNHNFSLSRESLRRVHEVRSPCQWLNHCNGGKCPAFIKINGNFYCAKRKL
ncbi:MAG: hypothetical protein FWG55_03260 [Candidatus Bathyarchaeota archaeon]|nr:hypothetical protein [Candidatus Termiticorpusculum sp.]